MLVFACSSSVFMTANTASCRPAGFHTEQTPVSRLGRLFLKFKREMNLMSIPFVSQGILCALAFNIRRYEHSTCLQRRSMQKTGPSFKQTGFTVVAGQPIIVQRRRVESFLDHDCCELGDFRARCADRAILAGEAERETRLSILYLKKKTG